MTVSASAILCGAIGFLLGSLPFGLWWGRITRGVDVREHGSKNLGATNVFRVLGPAHGIAVLLLDVGKGAAAVAVARALGGSEGIAIAAGLLAICGHIFSPFVRFRGGKGVAAGLGVWLMLVPVATGLALFVFAIILAISRRVSAGSLCASLVLVPAVALLAPNAVRGVESVFAVAIAALVWVRHRGNLGRLLRGEEPALWGRSR